ncbi:MAG: hypothetical protein CL916_01220 [Deltaproteobacteria bacterium]|nr:hypothetical protein [Deltaproteobacteria bacterium]
MNELTPPALVAFLGAVLICLLPQVRHNRVYLLHIFKAGALVGAIDLMVELIGTYSGGWTYHESSLFLFGTVPGELPLLFISSGIWLGAFHLLIRNSRQTAISLDRVLVSLTAMTLLIYLGSFTTAVPFRMIIFTLPFGLWGYSQFNEDRQKAFAIILASLTAIADWLIETWAVGRGSYNYAEGFTIETPLTYALLTLGFLGILELYSSEHLNLDRTL